MKLTTKIKKFLLMGLIFFIPSLLGVVLCMGTLFMLGGIVESYVHRKHELILFLIISIVLFIVFILSLVYLYKLFSKNKLIKKFYIAGIIFCSLTVIPYNSVMILFGIQWMRPIEKSVRLEKIKRGMTKDAVKSILGKPKRIIIKKSMDEYRFGQGEEEKNIKEGWIYECFLRGNAIEIYFDINGKVLYTNSGYC